MTSTNVNIGLGETTRNSSKVLKPPGGGTSDIFGASETVEQSPRRIRNTNHMQSTVFATNGMTEPQTTPRNKPGNDSHMRLFGPVESQPLSTTKDRMKSNISFGVSSEEIISVASSESVSPTDTTDATVHNGQDEAFTTPQARRNPVTGDGVCSSDSILRRSIRKRDGNPVTGEGYAAVNGEKETPSPPASAATTTNGSGTNEIRRSRVPPGGYSSGLW